METITFTAKFTFAKASVIAFAKFMGYTSMISQYDQNVPTIPIGEIPNPETEFDFIARLAKEHNEKFVTQWAQFLADAELKKQVDVIKPQIDQAIIQPVKDAIIVTYE